MGTKSPGRSACSGPAPHTHTQARHTHTHTHTLTSHNQFLQVYSYTTALTLERDTLKEEESCSACASRAAAAENTRPEAACYAARAVKRPCLAPTPHPRAGPDAVVAAGGAYPCPVQELIDEQTEEEEVTGQVFSSEEEEESSSDTD